MKKKVGVFGLDLSRSMAQIIRSAFRSVNVELCTARESSFHDCYAKWYEAGVRIIFLPKGLVPEKAYFRDGMRFITHFSGSILEIEEPLDVQSFKKLAP